MIRIPVLVTTIDDMKQAIKKAEDAGYSDGDFIQIIPARAIYRFTKGKASHSSYLSYGLEQDTIVRG